MLIKGFQKVTLLDYPGKIACTIFTGGCNLRCPFCHNASLVTHLQDEDIKEEEIFDYLKRNKGKIEAVCITGGEPLLQKGLLDFIKKIYDMGYLVKLDTNGLLTDKLETILQTSYVSYVAMDIKNCPTKYALTTGIPNLNIDPILKSVELLKRMGIPYEFRTTIVKEFHTVEDIELIAKWIYPSKYYLQQFEDSGDLIGKQLHAVEPQELKLMQKKLKKSWTLWK